MHKIVFAPIIYSAATTELIYVIVDIITTMMKADVDIILYLPERQFITAARTKCGDYAINNNADYVLFLDEDMITTGNDVLELYKVASHTNAKIVSGFYCSRHKPYQPLIYIKHPTEEGYMPCFPEHRGGIVKADATGMGCCLIHTDVFKAIEKPWFAIPKDNMSEDVYFFQKARAAGFEIWVHTGVICGHYAATIPVYPYGDCTPPIIASNASHIICAQDYLAQEGLL